MEIITPESGDEVYGVVSIGARITHDLSSRIHYIQFDVDGHTVWSKNYQTTVGHDVGTPLFETYFWDKKELDAGSVYRLSRNPFSLGTLFTFLGIGVASASWLYLLLSAIIMIITHFMVLVEERSCLNKFGDSYDEYMNRTPRWIGIPKSG